MERKCSNCVNCKYRDDGERMVTDTCAKCNWVDVGGDKVPSEWKSAMTFDKPHEWGTRFQFPENYKLETEQSNIAVQISIVIAEQYDNYIAEQIAKEARKSGVSDLTVLNKAAILGAINKQIPKACICKGDDESDRVSCPNCRTDIGCNEFVWEDFYARDWKPMYCQECGQAMIWRDRK